MTNIIEKDQMRQQVRETYGAIARNKGRGCGCGSSSGGLAGTSPDALGYGPADVASVPEGSELGLGCGNPTALASIKPGEAIVDLGSGAGFDCFLAAKQTGPTGKVIGVDMTPEMVSKARANAVKGNYSHVEFRLGEIENVPVADNTADLIISNCVINLSPDKPRVYSEIFRALKPGGRIAISDMVALQPISEEIRTDLVAFVGCVSGASSPAEVEVLLRSTGFLDIQINIKEGSRAFINEWMPGKRLGDYVASADIRASKPPAACCGNACCADDVS